MPTGWPKRPDYSWHAPDQFKGVRQFVGFVGYYRRFVKDFADLAEPLVALTRKGAPFVCTDRQQQAFEALKACFISAPILAFPTENGRFVLDTDASLFAVGGVLSQLQDDREVVIAYASRSLRQWRYCTTRREMLAAVVMCTHFRSYLRGAQFTLRTDHSSLRWLQRFRNEDGMLARWYLLLGQFSVTFEYRPGAQHANADGMSRQCGQCQRPDCPVSTTDSPAPTLSPKRGSSISLSPHRKWTRTYCRSCPAKLGWRQRYWRNWRQIYFRRGPTCTLSHLARIRRWRRCGSGFSLDLFQCGQLAVTGR